jgi:hypothetical protein
MCVEPPLFQPCLEQVLAQPTAEAALLLPGDMPGEQREHGDQDEKQHICHVFTVHVTQAPVKAKRPACRIRRHGYVGIMGTIRFGTCSWKYPSWESRGYPSGQAPESYLAAYAQRYDMVEVDQWFWSLGKQSAGLPRLETVLAYDGQTPATFRFTIKCPNALTRVFHDRDASGARRNEFFLDVHLMRQFIGTLEPIGPKIGLLMLRSVI